MMKTGRHNKAYEDVSGTTRTDEVKDTQESSLSTPTAPSSTFEISSACAADLEHDKKTRQRFSSTTTTVQVPVDTKTQPIGSPTPPTDATSSKQTATTVTVVKGRDIDNDSAPPSLLVQPKLVGGFPSPLPLVRNAGTEPAGRPPTSIVEQPGAYAVRTVRPAAAQQRNSPIDNNNDDDNNPSTNDNEEEQQPQCTTTDEGLVEADPISASQRLEDDEIPHADPVDASSLVQTNRKKTADASQKEAKQRLQTVLSFLGVIILIAGIVLALVFGLSNHNNTPTTAATGAVSPPLFSVAPSMAPTSTFLLELLPAYSQETILENPQSAQAKAYQWLLHDPSLGNYSTDRILQRYSLATLYYATGGDNWFVNGNTTSSTKNNNDQSPETTSTRQRPSNIGGSGGPPGTTGAGRPGSSASPPPQQYAWLDYNESIHECDWYNMNFLVGKQTCNDLKEYIHLELSKNKLRGSLPIELALLTSMESLALHKNELRGTFPPQLFTSWTNIREIMLLLNNLSGSLPSQLGLWANNLQKISLQGNDFKGSLPTEVWQLTRLEMLHLKFNALTGSISTSIANMERLGSIEFQNNLFNSSLPSEIALLATSLYRLQYASQSPWTMPSQLGQLTNLAFVAFDRANLFGTLPSELALLTNLQVFSFNDNPLLTGTIPATMGLLASASSSLSSATAASAQSFFTSSNQTKPDCPTKLPRFPPPRPPQEELDLELVSLKGCTGLTGTIPFEWCNSLKILCFDCSNLISSQSLLCGCNCPCPNGR